MVTVLSKQCKLCVLVFAKNDQWWDHRWLWARERTNNTAELSGIIEALLRLMQEAPDNESEPVMIRYDCKYAANTALGRYDTEYNKEMADEARIEAAQVMGKRKIT